jgi:hypothetical protein
VPYELALQPISHNSLGSASSAVCKLCENFGRGCDDADVAEDSLPLSTSNDGGARTSRGRRKTRKSQHWDMFRPDNIKKHHLEQHPNKRAAYLKLLTKKTSEPEALKLFFDQSQLEAFHEYRVAVEGNENVFTLGNDIVVVVVREMLFNPNNAAERFAGDRTMELLKPVFEENQDGSKTVVRYNCIVSAATEFEKVVFARSWEFVQPDLDSDRQKPGCSRLRKKVEAHEPGRGFVYLANHVRYRSAAVVRFAALFVGVNDRC